MGRKIVAVTHYIDIATDKSFWLKKNILNCVCDIKFTFYGKKIKHKNSCPLVSSLLLLGIEYLHDASTKPLS